MVMLLPLLCLLARAEEPPPEPPDDETATPAAPPAPDAPPVVVAPLTTPPPAGDTPPVVVAPLTPTVVVAPLTPAPAGDTPAAVVPPDGGVSAPLPAPAPDGAVVAPLPAPPPPPDSRLDVVETDTAYRIVNVTGRALSTDRVAALVGDTTWPARLRAERRAALVGRIGLYAGGSIVATAGLLVGLTDGADKPDAGDYLLDPLNYATWDEYDAAQEAADERYDRAYGYYRERRLWTGAFLGGAGLVMIGLAPFIGFDIDLRSAEPHRVWSEAEARAIVERYNAVHVTPVVGPGTIGATGTF